VDVAQVVESLFSFLEALDSIPSTEKKKKKGNKQKLFRYKTPCFMLHANNWSFMGEKSCNSKTVKAYRLFFFFFF
jgi:hypothetical protein